MKYRVGLLLAVLIPFAGTEAQDSTQVDCRLAAEKFVANANTPTDLDQQSKDEWRARLQRDCEERQQKRQALLQRERQAIDDARAQRDEKKRRAQEPPNQLKSLYIAYITMQRCYEARQEFRVQYVTKQELDAARAVTRRKEQALVKTYPALEKHKESLWERSKQEYGDLVVVDLFEAAGVNQVVTLMVANNDLFLMRANVASMLGGAGTTFSEKLDQVCKSLATTYTTDKQQQHQQIKKDF
jgi:hypothetical protein